MKSLDGFTRSAWIHKAIGMLPKSFELEDLATGRRKQFSYSSYLFAALAGPLFVLFHGMLMLTFVMAIISSSIVFCIEGIVEFAFSKFEAAPYRLVCIVLLVLIGFAAQAAAAIEVVRMGYIQRGWRETYYL